MNGERVGDPHRLQAGDILRLPPIRVAQSRDEVLAGAELKAELPILYEDEALLVIDKPAGIAVQEAVASASE